MSKISDDIHMGQIVSRQIRLWERTYESGEVSRPEQAVPCITISKEIGSQGVELGQRLARRLSWQLYDKELVEYIAENAKVRRNVVESFDEKTQSEIETWVRTLVDKHSLSSDKYFKHLMTVILAIAKHGRAVILGRGCNFILPAFKTLRLKIISPIEKRVNYIMAQEHVGKSEAAEIVAVADKQRAAFIRRFFHHDAAEPLNYDMVLNLGSMTLNMAEKIVMHALQVKFPDFDQVRLSPAGN
ncbi:MAG: AAA family ATPase [bacterium]